MARADHLQRCSPAPDVETLGIGDPIMSRARDVLVLPHADAVVTGISDVEAQLTIAP